MFDFTLHAYNGKGEGDEKTAGTLDSFQGKAGVEWDQ